MSLLDLPNELLVRIAWFTLKCPTCHCHHLSHHLSALARCNRALHTTLTPELLCTASPLHMLLWGITHSRQDTVSLAINQGANLNVPLRETHYLLRNTSYISLGTAVDIAVRVHRHSPDPTCTLPLDVVMTVLRAGGNPPIESLSILADSGDMALLQRCLPYTTAINERDQTGHTLLEVAGARGHVHIVTLLLANGATVNSTGQPDSPPYYPPLWTLCGAPPEVLQVLLHAGADATWEHEGTSIVAHLLQARSDADCNADLLTRHGSQGEEAISLWQAPVWETWTEAAGGADVVDRVMVGREPRLDLVDVHLDHHGLDLVMSGFWYEWGPMCQLALGDTGCMCPMCPVARTGGYRTVREVVGDGAVRGYYDRRD